MSLLILRLLHASAFAFIVLCCAYPPDTSDRADTPVDEPVPRLSVELVDAHDGDLPFVQFHNAGAASAYLLKQVDGSEHCLLMPYYRWTVVDEAGNQLKPMERGCGNFGLWAGTTFPDDYLVELQPGASVKLPAAFPFQITRSGTYRLSFEYRYEPGQEDFPLKPWRGKVPAPEVKVFLAARE